MPVRPGDPGRAAAGQPKLPGIPSIPGIETCQGHGGDADGGLTGLADKRLAANGEGTVLRLSPEGSGD
ncbi:MULTISPECIES: hypothetical protein [unclassified Streptomyces]|uniref:hypothetical protein n=1 Tax=unclassified Streptomyces TaxID=2593676 RepID=UPI001488D796|nr:MULTISPECIES: hypothetical protein [unclassified Streptomyces]